MSNKIIQELENRKVVPVVKLDNAKDSLPLAEALCMGGLPIAEVTFRTDAAEGSIRQIRTALPQMLVGAGTVINLEQAKRALDAGSEFIVTPGFSREVTEFALDHHIPIFPGTCTPTEIMLALSYGLEIMKFFPAKQFGGLDTIKALAAPFPSIRFMPTGGINGDNILDFLCIDKIIACGGSWMVKDTLILEGRFEEITKITNQAVTKIREGLKK